MILLELLIVLLALGDLLLGMGVLQAFRCSGSSKKKRTERQRKKAEATDDTVKNNESRMEENSEQSKPYGVDVMTEILAEEMEQKACSRKVRPEGECIVHTQKKLRYLLLVVFVFGSLSFCLSGFTLEARADSLQLALEWVSPPCSLQDGVAYFHTNPRILIRAQDEDAGLSAVSIWKDREMVYENAGISGQDLTGRFSGEFYIPDSGAEGNFQIRASALSLSGEKQEKTLNAVLDRTAPEIRLSYNQAMPGEGQRYGQSIVATLLIREEHFSSSGVQIRVNSLHGSRVDISEWSCPREGQYICTICFSEDDTYFFSCIAEDLAGNRSALDRQDVFTIDRTPPKGQILLDQVETREAAWFQKAVPVEIRVVEKNFLEEEVRVQIWQNGKEIPAGSWQTDGSAHVMDLTFSEEGSYQIAISGRDACGNVMLPVQTEPFVIDFTPPKLAISGLTDGQVWKEEPLHIVLSDTYAEDSIVTLEVKGRRGAAEILEQIVEEESAEEKIRSWKLTTFPMEEKFDDVYSLHVQAEDPAGNRAEASLSFRVNRFGSRLSLEQTREGGLILTECNVSKLVSKDVFLLKDGIVIAGTDSGELEIQTKLGEDGWMEYVIQIPEEQLAEEGSYTIRNLSRDSEGHINTWAGEEIKKEGSSFREYGSQTENEKQILAKEQAELAKENRTQEAASEENPKQMEAQIRELEHAVSGQKREILVLSLMGLTLLSIGIWLLWLSRRLKGKTKDNVKES